MTVFKNLNDPLSARLRAAVVEVEPEEIADVEKMLGLLDGDSVGHFGIRVELCSVDEPPKIEYRKNSGGLCAIRQFGFPPASIAMKSRRYYDVIVSRD